MHNPGEDVRLYYKLINLLGKHGYETFFCQMTNVYKRSVDIYREMSRMLELCINDIDNQNYIKTHKLHLMGCFIGGSRILNYCIKGRFKHRIKSVISINPLISIRPEFGNLASHATTSLIALMIPRSGSMLPVKYEQLTSNTEWLEYLRSEKYNFTKVTTNYLKEILHIGHILQNRKKYSEFSVHNVLLIHSKKDPISTVKGTEYFANNCPADNIRFLEYEEGLTNLFLESDPIFEKLSNDIITWLTDN